MPGRAGMGDAAGVEAQLKCAVPDGSVHGAAPGCASSR
jgi:hypothetical protein